MTATDLLLEIMVQQGIPEDQAMRVALQIVSVGVIDRSAVIRAQIQADPCRDPRVLCRRYHVSRATVYRAWSA